MAELPLGNHARPALIDDADLAAASRHRWRNHRPSGPGLTVARTYREGQTVRSQTLSIFLMGPPPEGHVWHHRNGDPLDHRRANLHAVLRGQHRAHAGRAPALHETPTDASGRPTAYVGVSRSGPRWRARIKIGDRHVALGTYATPEDAARAYDRARAEHLGLGPVNFPGARDPHEERPED